LCSVGTEPSNVADPCRELLSAYDDSPIILTHGDLHRSNIIVSESSPVHVRAIIDWEQFGWYPEYWEYCKTISTVHYDDEWRSAGWVNKVLAPRPDAYDLFDFYTPPA
jgi:thiamine kinase-like enzyme